MTDTTPETPESEQLSGDKPELFSKEFYAQFGELKDHVTFNIFRDIGLLILDDGTHKLKLPIYKRVIEESLTLYHEDLITLEQLQEFMAGLHKNKITRYALEVEQAKIRREAKRG